MKYSIPLSLALAGCLLPATARPEAPPAEIRAVRETQPPQEDPLPRIADLFGKESPDAADLRRMLELARQYRETSGASPWEQEPLKQKATAGRFRKAALAGWLGHDEDLAYRILLDGFLRRQRDDSLDPWFAAFAASAGLTDRALLDLEAAKGSIDPDAFTWKRLFLLRAAGRNAETLELSPSITRSLPFMETAVEAGAWTTAIRASTEAFESRAIIEVSRHFIAILARDPVLLNRHAQPANRTLTLLAGDPAAFTSLTLSGRRLGGYAFDSYELRKMAQDSLIAAFLETKLTQALSTGEPVPLEVMRDYFHEPDLLPNRPRAVRLASALAAAPRCYRESGGSAGVPDETVFTAGHRVVAAEALINLGRGDAAFTAIRPVLEAAGEVEKYPDPNIWAWGGHLHPMLTAYRLYGRIAELTWSRATPQERLDCLAGAMTAADPRERASRLFAFLEARTGDLTATDVANALWLPLHDLAQGGGVPPETLAAAHQLLERFHPSDFDRRMMEVWAAKPRSVRFAPEDVRPLSLNPPPSREVLKDENSKEDPLLEGLEGHWNPEQPGFVMVDGLAAVKSLLERQQMDQAATLMHSLMLRLCLDDGLSRQRTQMWSGRHGSTVGPSELVLLCAAEWDFPVEWLDLYGRACWQPATGYSDANRVRFAALAYAKAGRHEQAAALHHVHLLRTLSPEGFDPLVDVDGITGSVQEDALAAAQRGDREGLLRGLRACLAVTPYHPEIRKDLLAVFSGADREGLEAEADRAIDAFWDAKSLEVPNSRTYAETRAMWKGR